MPRAATTLALVLSFASLSSGCATISGNRSCHSDGFGNCIEDDLVGTAIGLGVVAVGAGIYYAATRPGHSPERQSAATAAPELAGQVRWSEPADKRAAVSIILKGESGAIVQRTAADPSGRFSFPLPRKPGWYTVSASSDGATGETTVWVQDRVLDQIEVVMRAPTTR